MEQKNSSRQAQSEGSFSGSALCGLVALVVLGLLVSFPVWAIGPGENGNVGNGKGDQGVTPASTRNFDARIEANEGLDHKPVGRQGLALGRLERDIPGLLRQIDRSTGATRTLSHPTRALTDGPVGGRTPLENARAFVELETDALGLDPQDLKDMEVTDEVISPITGTSHVYFRQTLDGIPVYNGQLQVNVNGRGQIQSVNNAFLPSLRRSINSLKVGLSAEEAVAAAAEHLEIEVVAPPKALTVGKDSQQTTLVDPTGLSQGDIEAKLMLLPINRGNARLVWNFQIQTLDSLHWYDINVDAVSGKVWTRFDWTNGASFRVYPRPVESPNHTSPLPPSDARVLVSNPENATASPNGWFDAGTTIMDGNNVHACIDANANNACDTPEATCSGLVCDFSLNLSTAPSSSRPAAVTNLFYWNNVIHDVQYQHGFNEAAGNFQENNFGRGGAGSDSVNADGQDGSGNCNANFSTPTDGGNPRMQMFLCSNANPSRDGDLDTGVIVHEYGHGISIRQVGGPGNSSCLNNAQQAGEGWSDWHGLVYTAKASDTGPQARGIGSYLFALASDGTIRPQRYSTSSAINNYTYSSIAGQSIPHGVGSVWAEAIWEVYWALVDKHGFDTNLYNSGAAPGALGNTRALTYINEGLKFTACSPTFIANRDGIIQAAQNLHGGEDVCDIWEAFAAFGLGTDASTGGSNSTSATNGFSVPPECNGNPPPGDPVPPACPAGSIDFNTFALTSYSNQNVSNNRSIADGGDTLVLRDNTWVRSTSTFNITSSTRVDFFFAGGPQGEIHAIGFDADDTLNDEPAHFQIWGTQNWTGTGNAGRTSPQYSGSGDFESFSLDASVLGLGPKFLVFTNDNDAGSGNEGRFACVRVVDGGSPPGPCTVDDDFEAGAAGWFNDAASTCTTGAFVLATPTLVTNGGVTTQVGGDHTSGLGNAIFTATNTSAGVNDVDGGTCILGSPVWNVTDASTLSVWYFHGQRDAGGDDFFSLEVSINGGSFTPFVSFGGVTSNAAWTNATTSIPANSSVQLQLRVADGPNGGDLVEGGIDDLSICPQ